jgi:hypothetical protein
MRVDCHYSRSTVTALFDDFDVRLLPQQPQYPAAGDRFIVNDQYADGHAPVRQGSSISAMTPPSSEFRTSKRACRRTASATAPSCQSDAFGRFLATLGVIDGAAAVTMVADFHAPAGARG